MSFGAVASGAGKTTFDVDPQTNVVNSANITLDPNKIGTPNDYAIDAAHEGTHVEDELTGLLSATAHESAGFPDLPMLTEFQTEYRGYQTSAFAAQALGLPELSFGGNMIWNQSWSAADREKQRDNGITRIVTGPPYNLGESTPHNPWPKN